MLFSNLSINSLSNLIRPLLTYLNTLSYDQLDINISKVDKINTTKGLLNISLFLSKNTGILYSLKITLVILS